MIVAGISSASVVLVQLTAILEQQRTAFNELLTQVEAFMEAGPLHEVLTPMPDVGVRTAERFITEIVGKDFQSFEHFAFPAGLTPVTWRSGPRSARPLQEG